MSKGFRLVPIEDIEQWNRTIERLEKELAALRQQIDPTKPYANPKYTGGKA